jgi:hypothetical protein
MAFSWREWKGYVGKCHNIYRTDSKFSHRVRGEDHSYATGYHRQAAGLFRLLPCRTLAGCDRAGMARDLPAVSMEAPPAKNFARPERFGAKWF